LRAEGDGGGDLPAVTHPAGREHRDITYGVDDLGPQHHRCHVTGVAAALVSLGDHDVDPGTDVGPRVLRGAGERRHLDAVLVRDGDHVVGRGAQRVGDQLDLPVFPGVFHGDVDV